MSETKYCEDCAHFMPDDEHKDEARIKFGHCAKAPNGNYHLVGRGIGVFEYCNVARCKGQPCGPEAALFEPKAGA